MRGGYPLALPGLSALRGEATMRYPAGVHLQPREDSLKLP